MSIRATLVVCLIAMSAPVAQVKAAEYFVSREGADTQDGTNRGTAFRTIQKGVDALEPGDVLTIGPGEYCEVVTRDDLGGPGRNTVIRAEIPQTVLLRGDVPAPTFRKAEGYRFVYVAEFEPEATAIKEVDTLTILESVPNVQEVEFSPGTFCQDADAGKVYISPSDLQPADGHAYTVCVLKGRGGIHLRRPQRVVLEGLAATGYNTNVRLRRLRNGNSASDCIPWGLFMHNPKRCVIRNCVAYLNAGGIAVQSGSAGSNVIEHCVAYGNSSTHSSEGGNILVFNTKHDLIRNCYAYRGERNGVRLYNDSPDPVGLLKNCLGWGHAGADFHVKAGPLAEARNCVALRCAGATNQKTYDSLVGRPMRTESELNNVVLSEQKSLDLDKEFADPANLDFRLQATSRFRGAGPNGRDRGPFPYEENIFYVRPDGSDTADGLSLSSAWKTLSRGLKSVRPGDTLYLAGGVYEANLALTAGKDGDKPICIRGRGTAPVVLTGALTISNCRAIRFQRLSFTGPVSAQDSRTVQFRNCRFTNADGALRAKGVLGLRATHCEFIGSGKPAVVLRETSHVFLRGKLFSSARGDAIDVDRAGAILYSDYNCFMRDRGNEAHSQVRTPELKTEDGLTVLANPERFAAGGPLGTSFGLYLERQRFDTNTLRVAGPFVHSVTDTTANIEWWSSERAIFEARWGETPECANRVKLTPTPAYHPGSPLRPFNTFSLAGLKPSTKHYFRIASAWSHDEPSVAIVIPDAYQETVTFTTAARREPPCNYYVAPDGDDSNTGLDRDHAWRTINHAAGAARPGDTVLIAGGVYHEHVRVRATGDEGRAITFKSIPGEKVTLDGANKTLVAAFTISNKRHVNIDGLYFRNHQRRNTIGMIRVSRVHDLSVTRCFQDGRGAGYDPEFLTAGRSRNLLVKNCVMINGWDGLAAGGSTHVHIENNVIVRPLIRAVCISGGKDIHIVNNIITDNLHKKRFAWLLAGSAIDAHVANNCFFLRCPESERPIFGRTRGHLAAYEKKAGVKPRNLVANPLFAVTQSETADLTRDQFFSDAILRAITDFQDLFTTNPELIKRGIGLQPDAFGDFVF